MNVSSFSARRLMSKVFLCLLFACLLPFPARAASELSGLTISPASVGAGKTSSGTVTLSAPAPAGGLIVSLSSDNAKATLSAGVTVAAGASSASFTVSTLFVSVTTTANITAIRGGQAFSKPLTIRPLLSPANLSATPGDAQVALSWAAVADAAAYHVKRATTRGGPYTTAHTTSNGTTTSYTNTGLTNTSRYYFVVTAVSATSGTVVESLPSNEASATPIGLGRPLTLTAAALSAGFQLTTFASNFPNAGSVSQAGPLGIVFPTNGGVMISDKPGNVRWFTSQADNQDALAIPAAKNYATSNALGLTQMSGKIYMAQQSLGKVVQLNADGTDNQVIASVPKATGITGDPTRNKLFVSEGGSGSKLWVVDPIARTATEWLTGVPGPDGLAVSPDGKTLYVATQGGTGNLLGYDIATKAVVFNFASVNTSVPLNGADGLALGTGALAGKIYVNCTNGTFYEINLSNGAATRIASGGSRGDFVEAAPDGTLLLTQSDRVLRLRAPAGGGFTLGLASLTLSPTTVVGGNPSTGTVVLNAAAPAGGVDVRLLSSSPKALVPATVRVAAGATSATFPVTTGTVTQITSATITATLGASTWTAVLAITPSTCTPASVSSVSVSPTSVVGGDTSRGTVTLSAPAMTGGQVITLSSGSAASVPASVLVAQGQSNVSFDVKTTSVSADTSVLVSASYHGGTTKTATLTVTVGGSVAPMGPPTCGPMDVAFLIDTTSSMGPVIENVKAGLSSILDDIETNSGGDYRLALVTFTNDVEVRELFAPNNRASFAPKLNALGVSGGGGGPEASDEALSTVVNALPAANRQQNIDFSTPFRPGARKIAILVTDAHPGGFDDVFTKGVDDVHAHRVAEQATAKSIQISSIYAVDSPDNDVTMIMQDYAATSEGIYTLTDAVGNGANNVLAQIMAECGGKAAGRSNVIYVREDQTQPYTPLSAAYPGTEGDSAEAAMFDTPGAEGMVAALHLQRAGRLAHNTSERYDLQWGVRSVSTTNLLSFSAPLSTQALANPYDYLAHWELPASFLPDLQARLGQMYRIKLADRVSSACTGYTLLDTPQQGWPARGNRLTFQIDPPGNPKIPQGRSLDITVPGTNTPLNGSWEIALNGAVLASSGSPNGWSVQDDQTVYRGAVVSVPGGARPAIGHEVRFVGQAAAGSGFFDVIARDGAATAPALFDFAVTPHPVTGPNSATATVTLDAPAPSGGATVVLASANTAVATVPATVTIARGDRSATFPVTTRIVSSPISVALSASYNGTRNTTLIVLGGSSSFPGAPTLAATAGDAQVTLSWNAVSGANRYNVKRSLTKDGTYALLFGGATRTGFVDRAVTNGTTYFYVVTAVGTWSEGVPSNKVSATPMGAKVAKPTISPNGGTFSYGVQVTLACATPASVIHYTTDGTTPGLGSPAYRGPFAFQSSKTVKARAFKTGMTESEVASAAFTIPLNLMGTLIRCGQTVTNTYDGTNRSSVRGDEFYAERYLYSGVAGQTITVTMSSPDVDSYLYVIGPSGQVMAENDDSGAAGSGTGDAQVVFTLPSSDTYTLEATSFEPYDVGTFTLSLECSATGGTPTYPNLEVWLGSTQVNAGSTVDFGTTLKGMPILRTFTLKNTGTAPLAIRQMSLPGGFTLAQAMKSPIAPNTSTTCIVRFDATSVYTLGGPASIHSNDLPQTPFAFSVTGTTTGNEGTPILPQGQCRAFAAQAVFNYPFSPSAYWLILNPAGTQIATSSSSGWSVVSTDGGQTLQVCVPSTAPVGVRYYVEICDGISYTARAYFEVVPSPVKLSTLHLSTTSPYTITWYDVGAGAHALTAKAWDNRGLSTISAVVNITVIAQPALAPPTITPSGGTFAGSVSVSISHSDSGVALFYTLDGAEPNASSQRYREPFTLARTTTVKAKAFKVGFAPSPPASAAFTLTAASVAAPPPLVAITAPGDGTVLTQPTPVTGSVVTPALAYWELSYRYQDETSPWVRFAGGTTGQPSGTFDTSLLLNGLYEIRLVAYDTAGRAGNALISVSVEGNLKVGNVITSTVDLTVPAAGFPITIARTYDSRDKRRGDFGTGWSLGLTNVRLQKSCPLSENWHEREISGGFLKGYDVRPTRPHTITITFPDGQVYRFVAELRPNVQFISPVRNARVLYVPQGQTLGKATLSAVGDEPTGVTVFVVPPDGAPGVPDPDGQPVYLVGYDPDVYDPREFVLTLRDGRQFTIHERLGLLRMTDLNGNTLDCSPTGIVSSAGVSVSFGRDSQGRITAITDPSGKVVRYQINGTGDLASVTDRQNNTLRFGYDFLHNLASIQDPRGVQAVRHFYDADGRLDHSLDAHGEKVDYDHNFSYRRETVYDRLGNWTQLDYDRYGNITHTTKYFEGRYPTTKATYTDSFNPDKPTSLTDPLNNLTTFAYSAAGDVLAVTNPLGDTVTKTYNGFGQLLTVKDTYDKLTTTNTYDNRGNLTATKDALGNTTTFTYNPRGQILTTTDAKNHTSRITYDSAGRITYDSAGRITYDSAGRITAVQDALGNVTEYAHDAVGYKTAERARRTSALTGRTETLVTQYVYDAENRLVKTIAPDLSETRTTYNSLGNIESTLDAMGRATHYTYDALGQNIAVISPGGTTQTRYDKNGRPEVAIDWSGRQTHTTYDTLGRAIETAYKDASGSPFLDGAGSPIVTKTKYDDADRVVETTDERGNKTAFRYDPAGQQTEVTDALGNRTLFAYDKNGRKVSTRDALGRVTTSDYDDEGRLTSVIHADGTTSTTAYDALGRRVSTTDPAGRVTRFGFDALGQLQDVTNALGHKTRYTYNEAGERVGQTDANGHSVMFAYDGQGRMIRKTLASGLFQEMAYHADGSLRTKTDFHAAGATGYRTTTYQYESATGRLLKKLSTTGEFVSYTYWPDGQRKTATRHTGAGDVTTNYSYDARGRLSQVAGPSGTITYGYDASGNRTRVQAPGGTTTYEFDALDRLAKLHHAGGGTTTHTYDKVGNRLGLARPNGVVTVYTYDALGRLTKLVHSKGATTLSWLTYTLDPSGKRTGVTDAGGTTSYSFDAAGQLIQESGPGGTISYTLDPVGNRLFKTAPTQSVAYRYNPDDRVVSITPSGGAAVTYSYDANGNLLQSGGPLAVYDFEDRLVGMGADTFGYDADGNRIKTTIGATTTSYLVDENLPYAHVLEERQGTTLVARYDIGDELLRMDRGGVAS